MINLGSQFVFLLLRLPLLNEGNMIAEKRGESMQFLFEICKSIFDLCSGSLKNRDLHHRKLVSPFFGCFFLFVFLFSPVGFTNRYIPPECVGTAGIDWYS